MGKTHKQFKCQHVLYLLKKKNQNPRGWFYLWLEDGAVEENFPIQTANTIENI